MLAQDHLAMTVICAEQVGKKYIIGHQRQEKYLTLRDVLAHRARGVLAAADDIGIRRGTDMYAIEFEATIDNGMIKVPVADGL
jgi:hypothetical protein